MKHVIIGTAGHVDHGKTTLVKALTGIDTDRLEEEKRRGVTIEPGFAFVDFDDGSRAGLIDVPGHERFIRNMLAGSGGVDLAMLIVAADEGVMPQTREHLGILTQLGIGGGLIVVTKTDLIESDWLELVIDDIAQLVTGTFLDGKPLITVSAITGDGLPELKAQLRSLIDGVGDKDVKRPFRLPVDRVFPVDGFGMVATGTLIEGSVRVGDIAEVLPSGEKATVRNVQVHGDNAKEALAGQRTAISLAGIKRGSIKRGDVISAEGMLNVTESIDVKLSILPDSGRTVKNGSELHLYHGARTMLVKVYLLEKSELIHSDYGYARLRLKEPLPCKRGDRFVVRFYSPVETIGGGIILDTMPKPRLSRSKSAIEALKIREQGSETDIAGLAANELGGVISGADLCKRADIYGYICNKAIEALTAEGRILQLSADKYLSKKILDKLSKECRDLLNEYHSSYPLRAGMNIAEMRQKLLAGNDTSSANAVLKAIKEQGVINLTDTVAALPGFSIALSPEQNKIHDKLIDEFEKAKYDVKSPEELAAMFAKNEKRGFEQVFESIVSSGELIMLSPQIFWLESNYREAVAHIRKHFETSKELTLAECRDMLGTSRKYALAFLEHLDGKQATKLKGDVRVLARGLDRC